MSYEKFYRFYDIVMGDRSEVGHFLSGLIANHKPQAKTILELACGTGSILGYLSNRYAVAGIDSSRPMLSIARKKLPHIQFFHQDMSRFRIAKQFDAIVCIFDSLNHLLRFSEWEKTFRQVALHLQTGGLFVFDVNTLGKLQRLAKGPAWVRQFEQDTVIIKVTGGKRGHFAWDVKIFEHQKRDQYQLHTETIEEIALPYKTILTALRRRFRHIKVIDPESSRSSDQSERLFFVCRK